ncbi:hypothetical protein [Natronomonas gomsonensis]|uniref:hypothetical protein n=1 Tax=Natronomonas gomsonensis TaxID=1046043 RepID=UPI0015B7CEAF|nr:hypothetical protein [Natronomonas gomsonensis]
MLRDRRFVGALTTGALAAAIALAYGVTTDLVRVPTSAGLPYGEALVFATLLVVPFVLGTAVAVLAVRHRVSLPLVSVVVFAALPATLEWHGGQVLVAVLIAGPLVVVTALVESLVRLRLERFRAPPSLATLRALSVGVMAATVYFGVFAFRAVLPLWRLDTGAPPTLPPAVDLALTLWYVFGVALVLVGLPVALNRRFGLVSPLVGLVAYLLVDLAFVQPAVAAGAELVVVLLLAVWPTLSAILAGVGLLEWWLRARRGEYDEPEGGDGDGETGRGFSVEGGLFGDRV